MVRFTGTVEYEDGRREEFTGGTKALTQWEQYAARHGYPTGNDLDKHVLFAHVLAWASLKIQIGFDAWNETVFGVDLDFRPEQVEIVPPTLAERSVEA